jgi:hypothetical protein
MKHKELVFTIDAGGSIHMIVKGIDGSDCCKIVDDFGSLGQVVSATRTAEYYAAKSRGDIRQTMRRSDCIESLRTYETKG